MKVLLVIEQRQNLTRLIGNQEIISTGEPELVVVTN
jgi:hypothetical protein